LLAITAALAQLHRAGTGIDVEHAQLGPTPVRVYRPAGLPPDASVPAVVIAHGFAGSQQLMESFAVTIARNGYVAVTFDFLGHGRNLEPLGGDVTRVEGSTLYLLAQLGDVVDYALARPGAGSGLAVLGHSMASDIVVRYAQADARVDATIAVSMFSPAVSADSPHNLLVIVGELEGFLRREAMRVLRLAFPDAGVEPGVTYGRFADGSARRVVVADKVEHVGVLFSPDSMRATADWLNRVYGRDGAAVIDRRGGAIVLLLFGIGLLGWPLARLLPRVRRPPAGAAFGWRRLLPAGLLPMLITPLLLWPFPADFLSVMVGGYLAVHFAVFGAITALCLWWLGLRETALPVAPGTGSVPGAGQTRVAAGLLAIAAATAYVAGVFALALDSYVTSFAVTAPRAPLLAVMLAGTLVYFLADEWLTRGPGAPRGAHVFTRACFLGSLGIAVALSFEDLFFLLIIAFVILVYFVVYGLFSAWIYRTTGHPAVAAVANAVAFAWALAVVFPMLSG
jgi:dienelactone hydrolase